MSLPRLTFLYPHLFKPVSKQEMRAALRPARRKSARVKTAGFTSTQHQRQETYAQRYGTAQEPQPPPAGSKMPPKPTEDKTLAGAIEKEVKAPAPEEKRADVPPETKAKRAPDPEPKPEKQSVTALEDRGKAIEVALQDPAERAEKLNTSSDQSAKPSESTVSHQFRESHASKPLATVLEMPAPSVEKPEEHKTPQLHTPPYVHHFDSYTLVNDLEHGGFTAAQSVTMMKAVRSLLAVNMDMAREGLVSKSDVENETYLFRAACSELRTEILNLRRSTTSKQKSQLSHLQHTYDILSQRTTAELASLRDELKGMLNDRRMDTRANSQVLDSAISELNYRISVNLGSDAKSEVEGLRWVLTRRAALAIAGMAVLILGTLRWGSYKIHEREIEARKIVKEKDREGAVGKVGGGGGGGGLGLEAGKIGGKEGDLGYVSLG